MSGINDTSFEGEDHKYRVATEQARAALHARDIGDATLAEHLLDEASQGPGRCDPCSATQK
ncbi:hypothetical protein GKA01_19650 [Gluconobacter kanchanaburiensis NBRC 103587]|uniref:Uncharacterized protein n=1 Tax=Gluconobacter kanchanaburiensis NBRC 103587 TaxID=1307948 RepID=A0A511B8N2_9PROT|nr:hypothetical protein AA103587_1816 [Gluconobacter kanchanaburiensis NBRC 103587]GEK96768.1 hypothetical protein GKA01_19650 [Gluconobacter kanchanaburiensis NBRC 103587]